MGPNGLRFESNRPFQFVKRPLHLVVGFLVLVTILLTLYNVPIRQPIKSTAGQSEGQNNGEIESSSGATHPNHDVLNNNNEKLHLLMPATDGGVDLCKTLLTAKVLGYPTPGLIAWNESYSSAAQMTGGSHLAKIFGVLKYLNSLPSSSQSDLVLMLDAYDIWFQLRPDVLINRFHSINQAADDRQTRRSGEHTSSFRQKIIFAAGKRCAPNQLHTVACYPVPPSPLPADLYGNDTDSVIGRNKYTSHRQRYLNSGYIFGRVSDLRILFQAAAEETRKTPDHILEDNGSGGSDFLYHGSDQSIFNTLFGRQEYMREVRRRKAGLKPEPITMEGVVIDDVLNPSFTHELMPEEENDMRWEYGIGLDYFSELGHQTVNSETDAKWMPFNTDVLETDFDGRNKFDCEPRVTRLTALADFEHTSPKPFKMLDGSAGNENSWTSIPLYTNLCTGKVPVMIHHNGDKGARGYRWKDMWFQAKSKEMLEHSESDSGGLKKSLDQVDIAWTDKGDQYQWTELCGGFDDMFD